MSYQSTQTPQTAVQTRAQGAEKIRRLLQWTQGVTSGYTGVKVTNMTSSWRDGLAFCAILHYYCPNLLDFSKLKSEEILENNELAFGLAEDQLGIPALLDAEDMVAMNVPDKLCVITYVSQYYAYFRNKAPGTGRTDGLVMLKPAAKQSDSNTSLKLANVAKPAKKSSDGCCICQKKVFIMERVVNEGKVYHRVCYKGSLQRENSKENLDKIDDDQNKPKFARPVPVPRKTVDRQNPFDGKKEEQTKNENKEVKIEEKPNILKWLQQSSEEKSETKENQKENQKEARDEKNWQEKKSKFLGLEEKEKEEAEEKPPETSTLFTQRPKALSRVKELDEDDATNDQPQRQYVSKYATPAYSTPAPSTSSPYTHAPITTEPPYTPLLHSTPTAASTPNSLNRTGRSSLDGAYNSLNRVDGANSLSLASRASGDSGGATDSGSTSYFTPASSSMRSNTSKDSTSSESLPKKKYVAPPPPVKKRLIRATSMTMDPKDIEKELEEIDRRQEELEERGVELEKQLRQSEDLELGDNDVWAEWFTLINEKNKLFRRETELYHTRRMQELEDQHADLEQEYRLLLLGPEDSKSPADRLVEKKLLHEIVDVVEKRNQVVELVERDRRREAAEDESIKAMMELKGLRFLLSDTPPESPRPERPSRDVAASRGSNPDVRMHALKTAPPRVSPRASPRGSTPSLVVRPSAAPMAPATPSTPRHVTRPASYHEGAWARAMGPGSVTSSLQYSPGESIGSQMSLSSATKQIKTPPAKRRQRAAEKQKILEAEEEQNCKEAAKREKEEKKKGKEEQKEAAKREKSQLKESKKEKKERKKSKNEKVENSAIDADGEERKKKVSITKKLFSKKKE